MRVFNAKLILLMYRNRTKGAAIINCDVLAHELYKAGSPLNATIAEAFGSDVITQSGEVDRRKLGQIVFSNKVIILLWYTYRTYCIRNVTTLWKQWMNRDVRSSYITQMVTKRKPITKVAIDIYCDCLHLKFLMCINYYGLYNK